MDVSNQKILDLRASCQANPSSSNSVLRVVEMPGDAAVGKGGSPSGLKPRRIGAIG